MANLYRYHFKDNVDFDNIVETLQLALVSVTSLHGEATARIDTACHCDSDQRVVTIDGSTDIGQDLNRVFAGYLLRELDPDEFDVARTMTWQSSEVRAES